MRTIHTRVSFTAIALLAVALFAAPAMAQSNEELERFRADLLTYVGDVATLPAGIVGHLAKDGQSFEAAEKGIRDMSYDELRPMYASLNRVPYWRALPQLLNKAATQPNAVPSPLELAAVLNRPAGIDPELVRSQLLTLTRSLAAVPPEFVSPEFHGRVARIEREITGLDGPQVLELQTMVSEKLPEWRRELNRTPGGNAVGRPVEPLNHCGSGSLSAIVCEFNHVFAEIAAIPGKVADFAQSAANAVKNGILGIFSVLEDLMPTAQELIGTLGLDNPDWNAIANTVADNIRLPCPPQGAVIPGFGATGEIETSVHWAGTAGFLGNMVADVTPGDILTSVDLQAIAQVVNFPIQWLSRCLENAYDDNYKSAQEEHRDLVEARLDVVASTRASQTNVNASLAATSDIDSDVAKVEGKLDVIEAKADSMLNQQGDTIDFLGEWKNAFLRQQIEADLFRQSNTRLALFQLPHAVGGFLEMAGTIVSDTIQKRGAAGIDTRKAAAEYAKGIAEFNRGNFKGAYSFYRTAYQRAVN
jgi:hypothetical protein